jgi:ATP-dependent DNA ligase
MTTLVPELADIPVLVVLDGELVALGVDGKPSQPWLCRCLLAGDRSVGIVFVAFDVLAVDGHAVDHEPYHRRRRRFEARGVASPRNRASACPASRTRCPS